MSEADETPKGTDTAGRLDGLVGRDPLDYHCHIHGWWNARTESGCPECVVFARRELKQLRAQVETAKEVVQRGVDLMTTDQLAQWTGVRSFLEQDTGAYAPNAKVSRAHD